MAFTWDEGKRQTNLKKHRFDFEDADIVFSGVVLTIIDKRFHYSEERYITIGMLRGVVVIIAHVDRNDDTRIISMRKATRYERQLYYQAFRN